VSVAFLAGSRAIGLTANGTTSPERRRFVGRHHSGVGKQLRAAAAGGSYGPQARMPATGPGHRHRELAVGHPEMDGVERGGTRLAACLRQLVSRET
jgi:hypothetical protein